MIMTEVKCSVSNCEYWARGNRCAADSIMIEIDKHANRNLNEEFATESFNSVHQDEASTSSATCCQTFKEKK